MNATRQLAVGFNSLHMLYNSHGRCDAMSVIYIACHLCSISR